MLYRWLIILHALYYMTVHTNFTWINCCSLCLDTQTECSYSTTEFKYPNSYGNFPNGSYFQSGYVQSCISNNFSTLCNEDLSVSKAEQICLSIGGYRIAHTTPLYGTEEDFRPPLDRRGFFGVNCSNGFSQFDTYNCNFSTSEDSCEMEGNAALITCVNGNN